MPFKTRRAAELVVAAIDHGHMTMSVARAIDRITVQERHDPAGVRLADALKVAKHFFGEPRQRGSHVIFRMPWPGDPRIKLQADGRDAKPYQVRQLLAAVERLDDDG